MRAAAAAAPPVLPIDAQRLPYDHPEGMLPIRRSALLLLATSSTALAAGCGGATDRSAEIGAAINGTCTATSYEIIHRLDNTKSRIYDCYVGNKEMCVIEENGITSDQTAVAHLLFQSALDGNEPSCAI